MGCGWSNNSLKMLETRSHAENLQPQVSTISTTHWSWEVQPLTFRPGIWQPVWGETRAYSTIKFVVAVVYVFNNIATNEVILWNVHLPLCYCHDTQEWDGNNNYAVTNYVSVGFYRLSLLLSEGNFCYSHLSGMSQHVWKIKRRNQAMVIGNNIHRY